MWERWGWSSYGAGREEIGRGGRVSIEMCSVDEVNKRGIEANMMFCYEQNDRVAILQPTLHPSMFAFPDGGW